MSIKSLSDLAVKRDRVAKGEPVIASDDLSSPSSPPADNGTTASTVTYTDALTSAIPTESLAAYTAVIAVFSTISTAEGSYLPARWWVFGAFMALTVVALFASYYRKAKAPVGGSKKKGKANDRKFPVFEVLSSLTAAASWGLVTPGGPLTVLLSGNVETLTVTSIIVGGGALVGLAAAPLPKGSKDKDGSADG